MEIAIIPSLLHGAGTWVSISEDDIQLLEEIQLNYIRLVFQVGMGVTKVALRAETGLGTIPHYIWIEKVMTIHHIKNMEENSLARKVWVEQVSNQWPGLALEVKSICEELGIPDANKVDISKKEL